MPAPSPASTPASDTPASEPFELRIAPSAPRRALGVGMLVALGLFLVLVALARPPEALGWRLFLLLAGLGALWLARRMWRVSARGLVLTAAGLREAGEGGRWLAPIEAVERVERGTFAFKPSNGFLLRTRAPGPRAWSPGVWWRVGRRVGVGGVLRAAEARAAADALHLIVQGGPLSTPGRRSGGG